eukprot:scaffold29315_cov35-Tisochrysis_lutea.AAC.4
MILVSESSSGGGREVDRRWRGLGRGCKVEKWQWPRARIRLLSATPGELRKKSIALPGYGRAKPTEPRGIHSCSLTSSGKLG